MKVGDKVYLQPVFVDTIKENIEEGKLYISEEHKVAVHLCACGCKGKTVTPLGKDGWGLINLEGKVTLSPSIGNWLGENPYHAHYWITDNYAIFV